jgi:hypothetical protein
VTKKDILKKLADNVPPYESVVWLGAQNKQLNNKTPAELISENNLRDISKILDSEIKRLKRR